MGKWRDPPDSDANSELLVFGFSVSIYFPRFSHISQVDFGFCDLDLEVAAGMNHERARETCESKAGRSEVWNVPALKMPALCCPVLRS